MSVSPRSGVVPELAAGVGLLGRGLGMVLRRPRLFLYGALPPLVTSVLLIAVLVALVSHLDGLARWLTPFADGWGPGLVSLVRALVGVALFAGAVLLLVITFTTLTLALGSPLYDKISESVDAELGPLPGSPAEPLGRAVARSVRQSAALIGVSLLVAPVLFAAGFIPVVGQVAVPVASAVFGGWMLCIELVGSAFERRGLLRLIDRRSAMRGSRARVLGFSVPVFLLLAVPFAGVVIFPIATAGATILARHLLATLRQAQGTDLKAQGTDLTGRRQSGGPDGRGGAVLPRAL